MKPKKKVALEKKNEQARVKRHYVMPKLTIHGDIKEITKSARKTNKAPQIIIS